MQEKYFPHRTSVVINQLKLAGLYSNLLAPVVKLNNIPILDSYYEFAEITTFSLSNTNPVGLVYYTTDGNDPRDIGGGISSNAMISEDGDTPLSIFHTTILKARVYDKGNWGPLEQVSFMKTDEDFSSLKITELHYHPLDIVIGSDTSNGKKYEFIEFKNTGEHAINLGGLTLDSAVTYKFPETAILTGGQFYVVSSKTVSFFEQYGMKSSGNYQGYFSNAGEEVLLQDAMAILLFILSMTTSTPGRYWQMVMDFHWFQQIGIHQGIRKSHLTGSFQQTRVVHHLPMNLFLPLINPKELKVPS